MLITPLLAFLPFFPISGPDTVLTSRRYRPLCPVTRTPALWSRERERYSTNKQNPPSEAQQEGGMIQCMMCPAQLQAHNSHPHMHFSLPRLYSAPCPLSIHTSLHISAPQWMAWSEILTSSREQEPCLPSVIFLGI